MRRRKRLLPALVVLSVAIISLASGIVPANAGAPLTNIVSVLPSASTPNIVDGTNYRVFDIVQIGTRIVVAGTFAQVQNAQANGGATLSRPNVFAFDATTGAVDTGFAPVVNGPVNAVAAGPNGTVVLGGQFTQVNGTNVRNLAEVNLADGARTAGFTSPVLNGAVNDLAVAGSRLFLAGVFTLVNNVAHGGLASIDSTTGALDPYLSLNTSGRHNSGSAVAPVGVSKISVSPLGDRLVAIGNFKNMGGVLRDQAAVILLQSGSAVLDPNWATSRYSPACFANAFDSYVRAVDWAPDNSYFVIVATGGHNVGSLCDTAARWNVADTGAAVQPRWIADTGGDTLASVAVTTAAVYVGGHERWLNNPLAGDKAGPGAVPRPGMAALDPLNGVPLSWNPGRNPRGIGAEAMLATPNGLYVGSDTDWIGDFKYKRQKIAYFPLAGGTAPASQNTGALPADVYLAGRPSNVPGGVDAVLDRYYTGTTANADKTAPGGGVTWSQARGAFMVANTLYYGFPDPANGNSYELVKRTFDGATYGAASFVTTPYLDPTWDGVSTGSPPPPATPIPYDGMFPNFYGQQLSQVTGMFYSGGRLYYVRNAGTATTANRAISATLYSRGFSTDSSIVSADVATVASSGFSDAGGMFVSGGFLYFANRNNGDLRRVAFVNGAPSGAVTVVSGPSTDGKDWRTMAMFIGPPPAAANQPPVASFTSSCPSLTCSFDASGSSDPNGDPLTYAWTFGDGSTGTGKTPSHTYAAAGSDSVTLTVNDGRGGTNSSTQTVNPVQPTSSIAFRAAAPVAHTTSGATISVTVPSTVQAGDGLVMVLTTNSTSTGTSDSGFTQVTGGSVPAATAMTTQVFQKVADGSEAGTTVTVSLSAAAHANLSLVAYSGTSTAGPVRTLTSKINDAAGSTTHTTPTAPVNPGDWAMSAWADKSGAVRTWTAPGDVTTRTAVTDSAAGSGDVVSLVADSNGPISTATYGGETATTSAGSTKTIELTVVLAGS